MWLPRVRFRLSWLVTAVIIVACVLGAGAAFAADVLADKPATAVNVLTGWAALYVIPAVLTFQRRIPLKRAVMVSGKSILLGLPPACLFGLFSSLMSGYIGLIGGFGLAMLVIGWVSLLAPALSADKLVMTVKAVATPPEGPSQQHLPTML
jgi:hypothetical protein